MTRPAREEYAAALRTRYHAASKPERGRILDEFCRTSGCHRKTAIRLLRHPPPPWARRRGRPRRYGLELLPVLTQLWEWNDRACGKLLAPLRPVLVAALEHQFLALNPVVLSQQITQSLETLWKLNESQGTRPQVTLG